VTILYEASKVNGSNDTKLPQQKKKSLYMYNVLAGYFRRLGEAVVEVVVVPDRQRRLTNVPVTVVVVVVITDARPRMTRLLGVRFNNIPY